MEHTSIAQIASGGFNQTQSLWMPASQTRAHYLNDPSIWWLDNWGAKFGFAKDPTSEYDFLRFIFDKGHKFEAKWVQENAPGAPQVCAYPWDVKHKSNLIETMRLMKEGTPIILQPALWWAPEKIHGVPDIIILSTEVERIYPGLLSSDNMTLHASNLEFDSPGYYLPFDLKFTSKVTRKPQDFGMYSSQVRIYAYLVGQIQGLMPRFGYLLTRDEHLSPVSVPIRSEVGLPLDQDLSDIRDKFLEIKENGDQYRPWTHELVQYNMKNEKDTPWHDAKKIIARQRYNGGDPSDLYEVNLDNRIELTQQGFPSIKSMLQVDPEEIPFEECKGLGPAKSTKIRTILKANRDGTPDKFASEFIPEKKNFEFYIDYEFFNNINVDFEKQWPNLEGYEMVFMIGVGWNRENKWHYQEFIAEEESQVAELKMINEFLEFLNDKTSGSYFDTTRTALYHWTSAEVWQTRHIWERHNQPDDHPIRRLPWVDLQKPFFLGHFCFPGAWAYGLKEMAKALGKLNSAYDSKWPEGLGEGLEAAVMGWSAYTKDNPLETEEMSILKMYLETDCRALFNILRWLRNESQSV